MQHVGYMNANELSEEKKEFLRLKLRAFINSLPEIQRRLWERGELPAFINPDTGEVQILWVQDGFQKGNKNHG